jgi:hypothetical protein
MPKNDFVKFYSWNKFYRLIGLIRVRGPRLGLGLVFKTQKSIFFLLVRRYCLLIIEDGISHVLLGG